MPKNASNTASRIDSAIADTSTSTAVEEAAMHLQSAVALLRGQGNGFARISWLIEDILPLLETGPADSLADVDFGEFPEELLNA